MLASRGQRSSCKGRVKGHASTALIRLPVETLVKEEAAAETSSRIRFEMGTLGTSVHWRLLRSNGLRLCRLQECCTTMRLWWAAQGTRTYWRCALNRTNIRLVAREVTCRISVRRSLSSTTVTAHLHLVCRALAIPAGVAAYHHLVGMALPSRAYCKRRTGPSRLPPQRRSHDPELQFDWSKFWEFLAPDLVLLVLAIAVSALYM